MLYPLFTIRNAQGQYLGTYRAKNAKQAIARLIADEARTAATFRKSQPMGKFDNLTATVERR